MGLIKKVDISCTHCGDAGVRVMNSGGVEGVPATYTYLAEEFHKRTQSHRDAVKQTPVQGSVEGRMSDFDHGKDHNA